MERKYNSVFIDLYTHNWILDILGDDIFKGMERLGYKCRKGTYEEYKGEDISFHMWWAQTQPHVEAKVNAVFITHTDDKYKEANLLRMKDQFDLFFCMSPEDAQFLIELGFEKSKVYGLNLPVRNTYVRPISIGIFSRCYPDGRKNENWLLHYCEKNAISKYVDFVFVGARWGEFVSRLSDLGCSFQWHNVSRSMPYEYMYQQLKLANLDYYIYMGMDGGAMGTYDAYAMGAELCVTDDGFHKGIPDLEASFTTEDDFYAQLNSIIGKHIRKLEFFKNNSVENYVNKVAYVIENLKYPETDPVESFQYEVREKRRSNYYNRGLYYGLYNYLSMKYNNWLRRKKYDINKRKQ